MALETTAETLAWYESQERVLTPSFLEKIPWKEVKDHPIDPSFVPVILYFRDVEVFTQIYYRELMKTETAKDPAVRQFMERWATEEPVHGELLNRFLEEAGFPAVEDWKNVAFSKISPEYYRRGRFQAQAMTVLRSHASAIHMTFGAISEQSTLIGYQRLWELAKHPVLEFIARAIAREEARHALFYWNVARLKLLNSRFRQKLTRFIVQHFWEPVGKGEKPAEDTNVVVRALFAGEEGVKVIDQLINKRVAMLPGFGGITKVTDYLSAIALG
jgi:rubrerythrin